MPVRRNEQKLECELAREPLLRHSLRNNPDGVRKGVALARFNLAWLMDERVR